ncbi:MAG: acyl-CoA synthetase [Deltaproteobacteria bacterium]|nr:acyl-CoA synthetase [Deltaproteobacteria bacterium]MBW2419390.1 acyl-CoA synthetase [Deltaproteobacteria bacterium]
MSWNFGDILEGVEDSLPGDAPALIHFGTEPGGAGSGIDSPAAGQRISWSELARRSNNLAASLVARGAAPGDKLGIYMRNCPAYGVSIVACFKARLIPVNVNFRYLDEELLYILDNSDAGFVVFAAEFAERIDGIRGRSPGVRHWIQAGGRPGPGVEDFAALSVEGKGEALDVERSGDDMLFVYTGGTTGRPKAVMWRHEALWEALGGGRTIEANAGNAPESVSEHLANVAAYGPGSRQIPACPLMHGTGLFTAMGNLAGGGCLVTLSSPGFDAGELFAAVEAEQVDSLVIVGDAFARPMLSFLDANPDLHDISSLRLIVSSGVMWSRETKQGLLRHNPEMLLADLFGSSEAIGFGRSLTSSRGESRTARFRIGERCKVFSEDHREVVPGSGERGFIARAGPIPDGYYKDPEKTAQTFPVIGGVRYSIPGDWCTVAEDGHLTLLGRGSACINTAGEKVHPEEVEEELKRHPEVQDALVVGVADARWGEAVMAVVELLPHTSFDEQVLRDHVRERLAHYKCPKRIVPVATMFRAPNGKADYAAAARHVGEFGQGQGSGD